MHEGTEGARGATQIKLIQGAKEAVIQGAIQEIQERREEGTMAVVTEDTPGAALVSYLICLLAV